MNSYFRIFFLLMLSCLPLLFYTACDKKQKVSERISPEKVQQAAKKKPRFKPDLEALLKDSNVLNDKLAFWLRDASTDSILYYWEPLIGNSRIEKVNDSLYHLIGIQCLPLHGIHKKHVETDMAVYVLSIKKDSYSIRLDTAAGKYPRYNKRQIAKAIQKFKKLSQDSSCTSEEGALASDYCMDETSICFFEKKQNSLPSFFKEGLGGGQGLG